MKADILGIDGKKLKSVDLPKQFNEEYRPDLIKRAVLYLRALSRQPYGSDPEAGMRQSGKLSRRRHNYKGAYGKSMSRIPRKTTWRRGTQFGWVGAIVSSTVGGRKAHPPKAEKIWEHKLNIKERRKAIRSAISSTILKNVVMRDYNLPIILEDKFENTKKSKDLETIFKNLNLTKEIERTKVKKVRAGKGKLRGRKYRRKKGPLLVVSKKCDLIKAASNFTGFDVVNVKDLNVEIIAPGIDNSRLVIYTEGSIDRMNKENLFLNIKKQEVPKKEIEKKETKKSVKKVTKKVNKK